MNVIDQQPSIGERFLDISYRSSPPEAVTPAPVPWYLQLWERMKPNYELVRTWLNQLVLRWRSNG